MRGTGLHPGLRAPFELCESVRRDLLALLSTIGPDRWEASSGQDSWTVAQYIDHLIRAEVGSSKMARRLIRGDYRGLERPAGARLYDSSLRVYPYGRYPAPAGLIPEPLKMSDATERLEAVHRRFKDELLKFEGLDPDEISSEDPDTGLWFTLAGWVCLQALHEAHHLHHIKVILDESSPSGTTVPSS